MGTSSSAQQAVTQARQLLESLSDSALREQAGDKVFARGKTYATSGAVQDLQALPPSPECLLGVSATVRGTEDYSAQVCWSPHTALHTDCDCLHAQDGYFCKHQVALAMVWRARLGGQALVSDPEAAKKVQAAAKRAQTKANNIESLRQFVFAQDAQTLATLLWRTAEHDKYLMADLKGWHTQTQAAAKLKSGDASAAQEAVRELLKSTKEYLSPQECAPYARRALQIFPIIESVLQHDPAQARTLCEDAFKRLYKVGESADDSWGGEFSDLIERSVQMLKACLQAAPPPVSWLKTWLTLVERDPWGITPVADVVAAAGPAVQQAYSAQLAKAWREWLTAHPQPRGDWDSKREHHRKAYLDDLERQGDHASAFEVMRSTASTSSEWVDLVQWCEKHKRWREAFDFAEKAFKLHPQDHRLEAALMRAYERDGYDQEALQLWRKRLQANPNSKNYLGVLQAAERTGLDRQTFRSELMAWACASETRSKTEGFGPYARRYTVTDVSVRVTWLFEAEGDALAALALLQASDAAQSQDKPAPTPAPYCQDHLLRSLALALPTSHASEAAALLLRLLHSQMQDAKSPYSQELALVGQICKRLPAAERQTTLAQLRLQYKPKTNFIKGLPVS